MCEYVQARSGRCQQLSKDWRAHGGAEMSRKCPEIKMEMETWHGSPGLMDWQFLECTSYLIRTYACCVLSKYVYLCVNIINLISSSPKGSLAIISTPYWDEGILVWAVRIKVFRCLGHEFGRDSCGLDLWTTSGQTQAALLVLAEKLGCPELELQSSSENNEKP